jgi:hypothetical protein
VKLVEIMGELYNMEHVLHVRFDEQKDELFLTFIVPIRAVGSDNEREIRVEGVEARQVYRWVLDNRAYPPAKPFR